MSHRAHAGARVSGSWNQSAVRRSLGVSTGDERRVEVLAQDLPCFGGVQLAVDVTLRGVLSSSREPHPGTPDVNGAPLLQAKREKEAAYPELTGPGKCRLVVVAIETGGRWSDEAVDFVTQLALAKTKEVPFYVVFPTMLAWDENVVHCVLLVIRRLVGGSFGPL